MRLYKVDNGHWRFESKWLAINFTNGFLHKPSPQFIGFQIFNISIHNMRDCIYFRISLINFLLTFIFITVPEEEEEESDEEQEENRAKKVKNVFSIASLFIIMASIGIVILYVWVTLEYFLWDVPKGYFKDIKKALKGHLSELKRKGDFRFLYAMLVIIATPLFWAFVTLEFFLLVVPRYYILDVKDCLKAYLKGAKDYLNKPV